MKIELFLRKINQDRITTVKPQIRPVGEVAKLPPGRIVKPQIRPVGEVKLPTEWIVSWPKSCCIIDFSRVPHKKDPGYLLRAEVDGAMLWDPSTSAVYKLDEEAYHTLIEIDHLKDADKVAKKIGVKTGEVKRFLQRIKELGIE